jgi:hypothetical protein
MNRDFRFGCWTGFWLGFWTVTVFIALLSKALQ